MTKLEKLKEAFLRGDKIEALRIAAKFPNLGEEADVIRSAWDANQNNSFYKQIGKDPYAMIEAGFNAIAKKYSIVEVVA